MKKMKGFKNDCTEETYVTHQNIKVSTAIKIAKKKRKKEKPASRTQHKASITRENFTKDFPTRAKKKKNICSPHQKIKTITAITITKTSCTIY